MTRCVEMTARSGIWYLAWAVSSVLNTAADNTAEDISPSANGRCAITFVLNCAAQYCSFVLYVGKSCEG